MRYLILIFLFFTGTLFSQEPSATEEIFGLLIEGADYSGKSTVVERVGKLLSAKSIPLQLNHCYISRNATVHFLWEEAKKKENVLDSSWYHAAAAIVDMALFTPTPGVFYLQDRNWLSHKCRLGFLHPNIPMIPCNYLALKHRSFKWNVYLTVSPEVRKERYLKREKKSPLNKMFMEDLGLMHKYDLYCISQIPPSENWIIIDTTDHSVDEIALRILEFIK